MRTEIEDQNLIQSTKKRSGNTERTTVETVFEIVHRLGLVLGLPISNAEVVPDLHQDNQVLAGVRGKENSLDEVKRFIR